MPHPIANEIVTYANTLVDIKWRHLGRTPARGFDCVGMLCQIGNYFKMPYTDEVGYSRRPSYQKFRGAVTRHASKLIRPARDAEHGDVICTAEGHAKDVCHVGILEVDPSGRTWMIHAWERVRRVVRTPIDREDIKLAARLPLEYTLPEG